MIERIIPFLLYNYSINFKQVDTMIQNQKGKQPSPAAIFIGVFPFCLPNRKTAQAD